MNHLPPIAQRWLIYSFFAIFCQLVSIFLFLSLKVAFMPYSVLRHFYAPWLEYPLLSLSLTIGGAVLFTYLEKHNERH